MKMNLLIFEKVENEPVHFCPGWLLLILSESHGNKGGTGFSSPSGSNLTPKEQSGSSILSCQTTCFHESRRGLGCVKFDAGGRRTTDSFLNGFPKRESNLSKQRVRETGRILSCKQGLPVPKRHGKQCAWIATHAAAHLLGLAPNPNASGP